MIFLQNNNKNPFYSDFKGGIRSKTIIGEGKLVGYSILGYLRVCITNFKTINYFRYIHIRYLYVFKYTIFFFLLLFIETF